MQVIKHKKNFKVLEVSRYEVNKVLGGYGICDFCNEMADTGYLICVLNHWYCPKCYEEWTERAVFYTDDLYYEQRNYENYLTLFKESPFSTNL
jgi:hypothetical protein